MKITTILVAVMLCLMIFPQKTCSYKTENNDLIEIYPEAVVNQTPFLIKISTNLLPNTTYEYSAYIYGGSSVISKIWSESWKGGYYYTQFKTNETGYFEKWIHLKVYKEPKIGYNYYLKCNIRNETDTIVEQKITKENGFEIINKYGWVEGYIGNDIEPLEDKIVIIKNETNGIVGISSTENNNVDDFILQKGCFNISAPVGENYKISIFEKNGKLLENISNLSVIENKTNFLNFPPKKNVLINEIFYYPKFGDEWIELYNNCTYPVNINKWTLSDQDGDDDFIFPNIVIPQNCYIIIFSGNGKNETDFSDKVSHFYMWKNQGIWTNTGDDVLLKDDSGFAVDYVAYGENEKPDPPPRLDMWDGRWKEHMGKDNPSSNQGCSIARYPNGWDNDSVDNWINFENPTIGCENNESDIVLYPDILITSFEFDSKKIIFQGDKILINATIKNIGNKNSTNFNVSIFLDKIDDKNLIQSIHYSSLIKNNFKNPSFELNTIDFKGDYSLILFVDSNNQVNELNESNNYKELPISIISTSPELCDYSIIISEICYDPYSYYDSSEFVRIFNMFNETINISGWQITDKEKEISSYDGTVIFPKGTYINPYDSYFIAKNASTFYNEMGKYPTFEYESSVPGIKKMIILDSATTFLNHGDEVFLLDEHNQIIDVVAYGDSHYNGTGWKSEPVKTIAEGEIFKRNLNESTNSFIDTNSSFDWETSRIYKTGQSDFQYATFDFNGNVKLFVSPDSSFDAIIEELNNAEFSIDLNLYEFTNPYLLDALINATERDVNIRLFLEGNPVEGICDAEKYIAYELWKNGVEIRFLITDIANGTHSRYPYNHAKYAIIDNEKTIIMSENWKYSGIPINTTYGNRGWGIIIKNDELTDYFLKVFLADWNPKMNDIFSFEPEDTKFGKPPKNFTFEKYLPKGNYEPIFASKELEGNFKISPILCPDTSLLKESSIINLLNSAEKSVFVEQMICEIDWNSNKDFLENLYLQSVINAARRGCEVKVLLDSRYVNLSNDTDNYDVVQYLDNISKNEGLENLDAKLIYLDGLSKLHNKGVIVDGEKTLISSINWGRNSVLKNREVGVIIENSEVADYFTAVFLFDWNLIKTENTNGNKTNENLLNNDGENNVKPNGENGEDNEKNKDKTRNWISKIMIFLIFLCLLIFISVTRDYFKNRNK